MTSPDPDVQLKHLDPELRRIIKRSATNQIRVYGLIKFHDVCNVEGAFDGKVSEPSDILRACVVLLHATLEDTLRSVALFMLPVKSGPEAWDNLRRDSGKPEKFTLGWLSKFHDKTVKEVLREQADLSLARTSYTHFKQVEDLLKSIGLMPPPLRNFADFERELQEMIVRRHRIVHSADLGPDGKPTALTSVQVERWREQLVKFTTALLDAISEKLAIV